MAHNPATRLPSPPTDLSARSLPIKRIRGMLFRVHRGSNDCLYFSKDKCGRFDDPLKRYGVLYAAMKPEGAFAEVFLRQLSQMLILEHDLQIRALSSILCQRVDCVDLTAGGLRQLSCDNRISTEIPYRTASLWSRAFFEHPQKPGGILYLSRHNPKFHCVAIFDRSRARLKVKSTAGLLSRTLREWTAAQISKYKLALQASP